MGILTSRTPTAKTAGDRHNAAVRLRPGESAGDAKTQPPKPATRPADKIPDEDLSRAQLLARLGSAKRARNANARKVTRLTKAVSELQGYKDRCRELEAALVNSRDKCTALANEVERLREVALGAAPESP